MFPAVNLYLTFPGNTLHLPRSYCEQLGPYVAGSCFIQSVRATGGLSHSRFEPQEVQAKGGPSQSGSEPQEVWATVGVSGPLPLHSHKKQVTFFRGHFWESLVFRLHSKISQIHLSIEAQYDHHRRSDMYISH